MLNTCALAGRLGADPEIRYLENGDPVAQFNLAFPLGQKKTGWIRIVCFKNLADVCQDYLKKGSKIAVSGSLSYETWKQQGKTRTAHKLIAHNLEFMDLKTNPQEGENGHEEQIPAAEDNDLPF